MQIISLNPFRLNVKVKQPASGLSLCHIRTLMRDDHLTLIKPAQRDTWKLKPCCLFGVNSPPTQGVGGGSAGGASG